MFGVIGTLKGKTHLLASKKSYHESGKSSFIAMCNGPHYMVEMNLRKAGEQLDGGDRKKSRIRADRDRPITGTRLLREWQGVEQIVTVTADDRAHEARRPDERDHPGGVVGRLDAQKDEIGVAR